MKEILYIVAFNLLRFFIWIVPDSMMNVMIKGLSQLFYRLDKKHRRIAKVNLDLAYEDTLSDKGKEKIIKACYLNLLHSLVDFVKNQGISKKALLEKVHFENESFLQDALESGKKVILITGHYGNWELVALSIAAKFGPMTIIGRKLDSKAMDVVLKQNREQFGIELLDKKGAMKSMINVLKEGRMLGLLVDQNTNDKEGMLVSFFGKPVRHTPSAAILSRRFDAVIIPVFITTEDHQAYKMTFYKPIVTEKSDDKEKDILESVQKQAKITEEAIRKKPEEWFWLHQRWKNQFEAHYNVK
ncbi:MAG: lipid A biosynthesis acyltransferase [Epsilonproteobacteria bacterium (ex Lamellibrachia satsuma)]|nr:MAG: lipid A biosynthesis acyltransferase [Epsilonproteobacteria bacterium (ex Lamellibrachia satsuma)]